MQHGSMIGQQRRYRRTNVFAAHVDALAIALRGERIAGDDRGTRARLAAFAHGAGMRFRRVGTGASRLFTSSIRTPSAMRWSCVDSNRPLRH